MNITDSSALHPCTSCQLCGAVCPKGAITIKLDKEGYYRPFVDEKTCIDCGLCTKFCYKFGKDVEKTTSEGLKEKPLIAAWSKDSELLKETTSGGIGDLLARQFISEGFKVVGVVYNDEKTRAEHRIASSIEETKPFRGSKYIQSYTFDALKEVVERSKNEKFAFFGTPCQVYALHRWAVQRKVRDNFLFVDLYCHGCPSMHIWTKYQKHIKETTGVAHFDKVDFRSKVRGWGAFNVVAHHDGKPIFKSKVGDDGFYELFFCDQVLNEGCNDCMLRGTLEYTDIRLGDFWGKRYLNNLTGVSAVSLATKEGQTVFQKIKEKIVCKSEEYGVFLPYQSWDLMYKPKEPLRSLLLENLSDERKDIQDAVSTFHKHQTIKRKIVRWLKNVLRYLPLEVTNFLKRFI